MPFHTCPCCRYQFTDDDELDTQLAARVATWRDQCAVERWAVRAGRVSESVAAALLGMRPRLFASRRKSGSGPRVAVMPIDGSRYSYDLIELAAWEAMQQSGESWKV